MERRRRDRYEAPLVYESDEETETEEKQRLEAEQLVEQLDDDEEDGEAEQVKENMPPAVYERSHPWERGVTDV